MGSAQRPPGWDQGPGEDMLRSRYLRPGSSFDESMLFHPGRYY